MAKKQQNSLREKHFKALQSKKIIFCMVLVMTVLIIFPLISSIETLGTFPKETNISLTQVGAEFTNCNITSVAFPINRSLAVEDVEMTKRGTEYNYTLTSNYTVAIGNYLVNGFCTDGIDEVAWVYDFEINAIGFESTDSRRDAANLGVYLLFGIATLFFLAFVLTPAETSIVKENGLIETTNRTVYKWTFFLLSMLFLMVAINTTFISIYNEIGNTQLGAIYDRLAAASSILFWLVFGLLIFIWVFASFSTLADRRRMKQARDVSSPIDFDKY